MRIFEIVKAIPKHIILSFRCIFSVIFILWVVPLGAQVEDENGATSNRLVFEANSVVEESFSEAEKIYRRALSEKPTNAKGAYNLGHAYYNSELFDEALLRLTEAAKNGNKEEKHRAFHNIGNTLMQNNDCKKAVEAYKNALRNNPKDDETRYNLALAQECAKEQGGGGKDEDQDKEQNQDQNNDEKKDSDKQQDQDQKNKEQGDDKQDKNKDGDEKDDKGNPKNNDGDQKKPNTKNQPQQGKMSPQQVKNLLEAMNNEEKKVQKKMNASKVKGATTKTDKDW